MLEGQAQHLGAGKIRVCFNLSSSKTCSRCTSGWHQMHKEIFRAFILPLAGYGRALSLVAQQPVVHGGTTDPALADPPPPGVV